MTDWSLGDVAAPGEGRGGAPSRRSRIMASAAATVAVIAAFAVGAALVGPGDYAVDPATRLRTPGPAHPFGADLLGRDMLARTLAGMGLSLWVGTLASGLAVAVAVLLAGLCALGRWPARLVLAATELTLGLPHLVLLMLIAYALGGGLPAVTLAIALTHWPRLSRLLAAETERLMTSDAVHVSRRLGRSPPWIVRHHVVPHLAPHLLVGFVVMFPHAILHEAGLSFLGLGAQPHQPSIGILLAESLNGLSAGHWWLALFPGLALAAVAAAFETLGDQLRRLVSLREAQA